MGAKVQAMISITLVLLVLEMCEMGNMMADNLKPIIPFSDIIFKLSKPVQRDDNHDKPRGIEAKDPEISRHEMDLEILKATLRKP